MTRARNARFPLALLLFAACLPALAADPEFKAGGVLLTLPAPADNYAEVGDRLRTTVFELFVPSTNRLLTAYVPAQALADLDAGKPPATLEAYGSIQVPRAAEYLDCSPENFEEVLKGLDPAMSNFGKTELGDLEQELNLRLKARGAKPVEVGRPEMLGVIFRKTDSAAIAFLMAYKMGDTTLSMAGGTAFLRLKQRLVFVYLFHRYESPETVTWLRKNLEAWCDALLARNR